MTNKIFWQDPYLTHLESRISAVDGPVVRLEETILFAFSGGQEGDAGTIGGYPVLKAQKSGFDIDYQLPPDHDLQPGDKVPIEIDWERRYRLMRLHFAAELILELTYRKLAGVKKIGAHIAADKARLDFRWGENISRHFPELNTHAQALIEQNQEIISSWSDQERQLRYWEIPGFARVACGGTHLRRCGEVGGIRLKRKNLGLQKERIEILLD